MLHGMPSLQSPSWQHSRHAGGAPGPAQLRYPVAHRHEPNTQRELPGQVRPHAPQLFADESKLVSHPLLELPSQCPQPKAHAQSSVVPKQN